MQRKVWVNVPRVARLSAPIWLRQSLKNLTLGINPACPPAWEGAATVLCGHG
jgi:hypothetical protein